MSRFAALAVVLGGCTSVYGLEEPVRIDAGAQAHMDGASDSMPVCGDPTFDEDDDGIADACDACPTIAGNDADADSDGLPDACDPNPATGGDRILFATMFTAMTDLAAFEANSTTWMPSDHGIAIVSSASRLRLLQAYAATRVELRLAGWQGASTAKLSLRSNTLTCQLEPRPCGGGSGGGICIELTPSQMSNAQLAADPSQLTGMSLQRLETGTSCSVLAGSTGVSATSSASIGSEFEIRPDNGSTVTVRSLVIYGAS